MQEGTKETVAALLTQAAVQGLPMLTVAINGHSGAADLDKRCGQVHGVYRAFLAQLVKDEAKQTAAPVQLPTVPPAPRTPCKPNCIGPCSPPG